MKTKNIFKIAALTSLLALFQISCKKDNTTQPASTTTTTTTNTTTTTSITWSTVFSDNFQRANGPIGTNYTTQLGGQGSPTGVASIFNNELLYVGSGYWAIRYTTPVTNSIVRVSANCTILYGNPSFGLTLKSTDLGNNWQEQQFYSATVDSTGFGIVKYVNTTGSPTPSVYNTLASKSLNIHDNHAYAFMFTSDNNVFSAYLTDLTTGVKDSIQGTDTGTLLTGSIVSLNGANGSVLDSLTFTNFKIETGK